MISDLIFNRKRSEEEYKTVYNVIERINSAYPSIMRLWGRRAKNYEELQKLPGIIFDLMRENENMGRELQSYKEQAETVSSVIDTILDTVEKRYDMRKGGKND